MEVSSLLFQSPKTYAKWWTFVPVLPASRDSHEYKMLRRQWADHTMNCLSVKDGILKLTSSRGFYVENREDHIMTVLFHIWAMFPDVSWVGPLLDLWGAPHGQLKRAAWSYSWEQKRDKASRPDITDIVVSYEDEHGQGILVLEAKRPGGRLKENELDGGVRYLTMPSIRPFVRKRCGFLVDERDAPAAIRALPPAAGVVSWQDMGRLQKKLVSQLRLPQAIREQIATCVARHYADLGMNFDSMAANQLDCHLFTGSEDRYQLVHEMRTPSSVERFLLGAEVTFCARAGRMPRPPFSWLSEEPSFVDIVQQRPQTTRDREVPLWRLPSIEVR